MNRIEKIQLYLEGKLNATEQKAFELEIEQDASLREEVEDYRKIPLLIKQLEEDPIEAQIRKSGPLAELEAFAKNNYEDPDTYKFRSGSTKSAFITAKKLFSNTLYEACVEKINNEITKEDSTYLQGQYLKGHAYYKLTKYQDAIPVFAEVRTIANGNHNYLQEEFSKDNAEWTLVICRLQVYLNSSNNNTKSALLKEIDVFLKNDPADESYKKDAKTLLELLGRE